MTDGALDLPEQPIFYPVMNEWYATKIAREWNVPHAGVGYVTEFDVDSAHLERFPVQQVGGIRVIARYDTASA